MPELVMIIALFAVVVIGLSVMAHSLAGVRAERERPPTSAEDWPVKEPTLKRRVRAGAYPIPCPTARRISATSVDGMDALYARNR